MEKTDLDIVLQLRRMAHQKYEPAQMLREIIPLLNSGIPHKLTLIAYMRDAFNLSLAEASPIAGWASDTVAELSDSQLNNLIWPAIARNEHRWNQELVG